MLAIPDGALALGLGTVLALGAPALELRALLGEAPAGPPAPPAPTPVAPAEASAIEALREIEFDRATGKLSDADYAELRATYTREALAEMRAKEGATAAAAVASPTAPADGGDDAVEAALRAFRARAPRCAEHGARPEADARFCSDCGRFLAGRCPACGGVCDGEGQRFCGQCGSSLAA
ncbi:zinc ribbon domain-containing protein [Roseisolibacter sp. H3M3-2]|uniref:zinc ribbon domain-containing protein n=1 Tax=Roseisolibacter sp. H3M3-2 TaxID=3031323 RepID=UPI0023D99B55|nr:zinc ribbon domain-containing protein [Roseisolibacter sp. H3M3-2]MDF1503208.1 zinc ribbon domain-containing protein [Roseisolibacter sp. H3M3-2]